MNKKQSVSLIAAAVFAALSSVAVAQQTRQSTGASQSSQTNPSQTVAPSAATGVESSAQFRGNHNTIYMDSSATTNQSTSASQNTGSTQGATVSPTQSGSGKGKNAKSRQSTGASQASQTNPTQTVAPSAATGVESSAQFRGNHNTVFMDSQATTNQSTSASQNTGSTQGLNVSPSQNPSASGVPGMGAVPGVSGNVSGGAAATTGGTSSAAGGAVSSDMHKDGPGKRGKGWAKGHDKAPGQNR